MSPHPSTVARADDAPSKRALLEAALKLFVRDGLAETTIRDVAAEAGCSNPAIFKFFSSREELARCAFERCYERLATAVGSAAGNGSFDARMRAVVLAAAQFMDADLPAFLFVTENLRRFWPDVSPTLRKQSITRVLKELFVLGLAQGRVSPDHDVALLVAATIGTLTQVARALYFKELTGTAVLRAPELERLMLRMAW